MVLQCTQNLQTFCKYKELLQFLSYWSVIISTLCTGCKTRLSNSNTQIVRYLNQVGDLSFPKFQLRCLPFHQTTTIILNFVLVEFSQVQEKSSSEKKLNQFKKSIFFLSKNFPPYFLFHIELDVLQRCQFKEEWNHTRWG